MQHWEATPEIRGRACDGHLGAGLNGEVAKHGNGRLIRFGCKPYQSHEKLMGHKVGAKFREPQGLPLGVKQTKGRGVPTVAF